MIILTILTILNCLMIIFILFLINRNNLSFRNSINNNHSICCERTEYNHKDIETLQEDVQSLKGDVKNISMQIPDYDPNYLLNNILKL